MARKREEDTKRKRITKESISKAKRIFTYMRPYRWTFFIGWIFLLLSTSTGLIFPFLMGQLLGEDSAPVTNMEGAFKLVDFNDTNSIVLMLFILFGAQALFSFFRVILFTHVTENTLRDIRVDAFKRLIHMPMDFFNQNKVGELTSRISADIIQVQETLRTTIAEFIRQLITVLVSIVILAMLSWKLALIMLATIPAIAILGVFFGRYIRRLSKEAQNEAAESNTVLEESLTGIYNVKAFTNEGFLIQRFQRAAQSIRALQVKSGLWRGMFISFIIFCVFGAIVFVIWQGIQMTKGPNPMIDSNNFFSFIMYTIMIGASIGSLPDLYTNIQKSIGATENLMEIIGRPNETELLTGTQMPEIQGTVEFKGVHFSYPQRSDFPVLKNVNFAVDKNQTIAFVGASGAGKSTIASLLLNYYTPQEGSVLFDGNDSKDIDVTHLREHIAVVPQEVLLFAGTIRENIRFGNTTASEEQVIEAAKQANALSFINAFPDGLDTHVGDRGIQLSGGQKQRIAIARAILKDPAILILDEATSALDSESEKLVQEALVRLMEGRTSFVIAHRLSTIREADNILVLEDGSIKESGTHDELVGQDGTYAQMVRLQNVESHA